MCPSSVSSNSARIADLSQPDEAGAHRGFRPLNAAQHLPPARLAAGGRTGTGQRALGIMAEQGGALTGWLPLTLVHSPLFWPRARLSGFAVAGGVLGGDEATCEALCRAAQEVAIRRSCSSIETRGGIVPADWNVTMDSHCGFMIPLAATDQAQTIPAIPRKQRAEVRKGLKTDLEVTVGTAEEDRTAHYDVYAQSVHNLGTPYFFRAACLMRCWIRWTPIS